MRKGLKPVRFETADDLFQALVDEQADAILHTRAAGLLLKPPLANQVRPLGSTLRADTIALGLRQDSPLREDINHALLHLREQGGYDEIYARWFRQNE